MEFSFVDHVRLLDRFLERRQFILQEIESRLLNVQRKDVSRFADRRHIEQVLSFCFFDSDTPSDLARLRGQLSAAHHASGFEAVHLEGDSHEFSPSQLVALAYHYWMDSRWPGRNVRIAYAETVYSAFVLLQFEHLSLRVWDEGTECAATRLHEVQRLLDRLNNLSSNTFVRSAPWLLQTAQGPLTRQLQPYFKIADQISGSFENDQRLEIHRSGALLAGGHLRSQLLYRARESQRSIDDVEVLSVTRNSNSMDAALLVYDLVPLLQAYRTACVADDKNARSILSNAILQGVSADSELFLTRLDVLGPATMIEEVFIERGGKGQPRFTKFGIRHHTLLAQYRELICSVAAALKNDAERLAPARSIYSPLGIVYGFCADILSNTALARLVSQPASELTLEDVFSTVGSLEGKLARATQWATLPRHSGGRSRFEHSTEWATEIFTRLMRALDARATRGDAANASGRQTARLFVSPRGHSEHSQDEIAASGQMVHTQEYCVTSDLKRALTNGATAFPKSQILSDRKEGRFLASSESDGKWFGVSKALLTACTCQGKDAVIRDVPDDIIDVLRLTCPEFLDAGQRKNL